MRFVGGVVSLLLLTIFLQTRRSVWAFAPHALYSHTLQSTTMPPQSTFSPSKLHIRWHKRTIKFPFYPPTASKTPASKSALRALPLGNSLFSPLHSNVQYCFSILLLLGTFGISMERRTTWGKALSAPLTTMAAALLVANLRLIPFASQTYQFVNSQLIPLAVPLLLYDSDLRRVLKDTGSLLIAFVVGAVATIVATLVVYPFLPMTKALGSEGYKIACALAARHIGGAINFVAVAETMQISGTAVSAAIAADNVVVALYFALLFALSGPPDDDSLYNETNRTTVDEQTTEVSIVSENEFGLQEFGKEKVERQEAGITLPTLAVAISVASSLVTAGGLLTRLLLPSGTSALPLTSVLTVAAATMAPKFFSRIRMAGSALGILFIQLFFAASGASGSIGLVVRKAPSLFAFSALQIAVHFAVLMGLGKGILRLKSRELYLSSNANVGGPTTAAAMAQAKNWKRLVMPALLIGILGYASATAIALLLGPILLRLPVLPWTANL